MDDLYELDSDQNDNLTQETAICEEMRKTAQALLDTYVRMQGNNLSQMLRKSVESRDWLNCLEPRSVRAVMKRLLEELEHIETVVASLYDQTTSGATATSSESSRKSHYGNLSHSKQHFRSNWSNYTNSSQLESSYATSIHRLFSERIEIFSSVEFSKFSIITGIIKIALKVRNIIVRTIFIYLINFLHYRHYWNAYVCRLSVNMVCNRFKSMLIICK